MIVLPRGRSNLPLGHAPLAPLLWLALSACIKASIGQRQNEGQIWRQRLVPTARHLLLSVVCEGASLAEYCFMGAKIRLPPCSSLPLAACQVGLWAVVILCSRLPQVLPSETLHFATRLSTVLDLESRLKLRLLIISVNFTG